ncbi:hypothetical protein [Nonomuraea sp. NPDC049480]|uniref:hypothetical protein n=1 Tax=Nonomuraea sp. NPDC049480 TaxID=3364353 RepID=UPI00379057C3
MVGWSLVIAFHVAIVGLLLYRAFRPQRRPEVAEWAAGHGLRTTDLDWDQASRYLYRSRCLRTVGFVIPFLVGSTMSIVWALVYTQPSPPFPFNLLGQASWLGGYLLGAVLAEVTWTRPRTQKAAALVPRQVADYIGRPTLILIRVVGLATIAVGVIGHWFLAGHIRAGFGFGPAPAVTATAVLVTMEASLWFIVHRRQPVGSESQMMLDDALRSTTIHRMAGAGLGMMFLFLGYELFSIGGGIEGQALRIILPWAAMACMFVGAPLSWRRVGHPRLWLVRRHTSSEAAPRTDPADRTAT